MRVTELRESGVIASVNSLLREDRRTYALTMILSAAFLSRLMNQSMR